MQLGDIALGDRVDADLVEDALLVEAGNMFEVAREAVEAFRQDDLHLSNTNSGEQGLITGAEHRRA